MSLVEREAQRDGFKGGQFGAVYTCECCGKRTRVTSDPESQDAKLSGICLKCYINGGLENFHSDEGHEGEIENCPICKEMGYIVD